MCMMLKNVVKHFYHVGADQCLKKLKLRRPNVNFEFVKKF